MTRSLTLDGIGDHAGYEDEGGEFRTRILIVKKRRGLGGGRFGTVVVENREAMRFQVQEVAAIGGIDPGCGR